MLSDEQMSNGWPFSLLNDEQMSNKVGVEHQPENVFVECMVEVWLVSNNNLTPQLKGGLVKAAGSRQVG